MDPQYEERFGVKVDTRIPAALKAWLYEQFEAWREGSCAIDKRSLLTRYEHWLYGSGIEPTPDPFKPLALQSENADLGAVVAARRKLCPPGEEHFEGRTYQALCYATALVDFETVTGLNINQYLPVAQYPEIDENGRIGQPRIVAVVNRKDRNRIDFNEDITSKLQLPTSREVNWRGTNVREVFDFTGGYRIELVRKKEDS